MLISGPDAGLNCSKLLPAPPAVFESIVLLTSGLRVGGASVLSGSREALHVTHRAVFLLCMPDYLVLHRANIHFFACLSE